MNMKSFFCKIFGLVLGFCVLCWLITKTGTYEILRVMEQIDISDVVCALFLIFCGVYLRALRWKGLFSDGGDLSVYSFFSAIMIGNLANNILPARGGDIVRVYMLWKNTPLSRTSILATILIERLSELFIICSMLLLILYEFPLPSWIQRAALLVGGTSFVGLFVLMFASKKAHDFAGLFVKLLGFLPIRLSSFLKPIIREFMNSMKGVISTRSFFYFIFLTILIWSSEIGILWFFARSFGFVLSFLESWVVMIYTVLSSFIPILPAQIGVLELAVQSAMSFLGHEGAATLAFALSWHLSLLCVGTLSGLMCLVLNNHSLFITYKIAQREMET